VRALVHGFTLDLLLLFQDLLSVTEIEVGWRQVPKALMVE
jgi:hypothetical protein|tara:strand:- start:5128 stop:5247 length:120 start_codon:yes stop_codon:yes gene_type:complete